MGREETISPRVSITGTRQRPLVDREETISPRVSIIQDEDQNLGQNLLHQEVATTTVGPPPHLSLLSATEHPFISFFLLSFPTSYVSFFMVVCVSEILQDIK